ncbi:hypothetical protein Smic_49760 [Streptomyces microflavus]|uniref:Uncharacterized protein n=1 Tax=Streptomyces microflavus TaxID=1919 RepID=A0A7J0CV57_STRMI|nr:hypothetical protein Smic_49760 [Streptomyces microflavus]
MEAPHSSPAADSRETAVPEVVTEAVPGAVTVTITVESPEQMQDLGRRLARVLAPATWSCSRASWAPGRRR